VWGRFVECGARSYPRAPGVALRCYAWRRHLFSILVLILACSRVEAGCVDPTTLAHSTVSITRHFDEQEQEARAGVIAVRGTGWFLSPTLMVTVAHVAESMTLSHQTWTQIELRKGESKASIPARIWRLAGDSSEKIAVLELQTAFSGAQGLQLRMEPLVPGEPVVSLAYPGGRQRVAGGQFVRYGDGDKFAGVALLEMYDGNDRLVLDHGASGAPVVDCSGRVVAVVSNLFTTTMRFMSSAIRISTAWGSPNVTSVPIPVLKDFARSE
jgi:S1-C subfamily serine protease